MKQIVIDLKGVNERNELWERISNALNCPEYFGRNLDAFHDVLGEIATPTQLYITNSKDMKEAMPEYYEALDDMLSHAVVEFEHIYVAYERN